MTVDEWLVSEDAWAMLLGLDAATGERKLRLFAVGCCRQVWDSIETVRCRRAVETAERFADGAATLPELRQAFALARKSVENTRQARARAGFDHDYNHRLALAADSARPTYEGLFDGLGRLRLDRELSRIAPGLLRCVFGPDPGRPSRLDPGPLSPVVIELAWSIYRGRDFEALPVLGDALEEAGCTEEAAIRHCRESGPHARGCWAVDFVLAM